MMVRIIRFFGFWFNVIQCLITQKISYVYVRYDSLKGLLNGSRTASQASNTPSTTKILYFTNRSVTPFMCSISKRIGDICLADFKALFDRPGFYRYHFKAVDQEFGMVKEEVSNYDTLMEFLYV